MFLFLLILRVMETVFRVVLHHLVSPTRPRLETFFNGSIFKFPHREVRCVSRRHLKPRPCISCHLGVVGRARRDAPGAGEGGCEGGSQRPRGGAWGHTCESKTQSREGRVRGITLIIHYEFEFEFNLIYRYDKLMMSFCSEMTTS